MSVPSKTRPTSSLLAPARFLEIGSSRGGIVAKVDRVLRRVDVEPLIAERVVSIP